MKLSEYIKGLQEVFEEHGDIDCYYAVDDEGNAFRQVHYESEVRFLQPEIVGKHFTVEHLYMKNEISEEFDDCEKKSLVKVCLVN